jgi:ApaG protein
MANDNDNDAAYAQTTRAITIMVEPIYLEEQSEPDENRYLWAYHVRIENNGADTVQLLTRHWRITDSVGNTQEVRGDGVVGEQPVLRPGESFEYTSGTPLPTPSGIMAGSYQMQTDAGDRFDAEVPAFSLDCPDTPMRLH